jgi:hypothetical protein
MAFYKYFWDLENSTTYDTHTVGQFDNNATTGGGTFRWVGNVTNTGITNIAGMRIKPRASTLGYWERVYDGPVNVGWFGCQNTATTPLTFGSIGVSQATLDLRYGTGFTTTNDCYDSTAIRYAFKMMGSNAGYQSLMFDPTKYWVSKACQLPVNLSTSSSAVTEFIIDGNGCNLVKFGVNAFNFFERIPTSQSAASITYINNSFIIKNFNVNGVGGTNWTSNGSFIRLGAATNCVIENINLTNFAFGLQFENIVNSHIRNISSANIAQTTIYAVSGSWTGAIPANSQCRNLSFENIKVVDSLSQGQAMYISDSENVTIDQFSLTGTGNPSYGIRIVSNNANLVRTAKVTNSYFDILLGPGAATSNYNWQSCISFEIYFTDGGRFVVDGLVNKQANPIVNALSTSGNQPDIYIANVGTWPAGSKLGNISVGSPTFDLYNVRFGAGITTAANVVNPANSLWNLASGATIPNVANVRYVPPIVP